MLSGYLFYGKEVLVKLSSFISGSFISGSFKINSTTSTTDSKTTSDTNLSKETSEGK